MLSSNAFSAFALSIAVSGCTAKKCAGAQGTATVDLAVPQGTPVHYASGFLYGIPDTPDQVPDHFYTDMDFRYTRAGGSQLPAPARGWVWGVEEFQNRFSSAVANYKTARKYGARFQLLTSDIWGADGSPNTEMPGDNGNWTSYDDFLEAVFANIHKYDMLDGLDFEIWNEPDLTNVFWQASESQYLDMWGRGFHRIRAALPNTPIDGPCSATVPSVNNTWYAQFYPFVLANGSVPDIYCWHEEGGPGNCDVQKDVALNEEALKFYGLPPQRTILNEYAVRDEQNPGSAAWFISRFERVNITGLRGNWASAYSLHDYFANLLGKPTANEDCTSSACNTTAHYWGNGEYNVYKYYNKAMTGHRVQTVGSADNLFDVYATNDARGSVKLLCGTRLSNGTYNILVNGLHKAGLPREGNIKIRTYQFSYTDGIFGDVPSPKDLGISHQKYHGNQLVLPVHLDNTTAYAFEFEHEKDY